MVRYEISLILRSLPKDKLKDAFKIAAGTMMEEGALIRDMKHLGTRQLPFRMKAHKMWFTRGSYVVCDLEASPQKSDLIIQRLREKNDIIKAEICKTSK